MNSKTSIFLARLRRQTMALGLSVLLIPAAQFDVFAQAPAAAYVELEAPQLDQLVAPIALDPDSLVAQILTGATYPDQIAAADAWLNQNMNLPPDQRAAGANAQPWDPAVKGLTEFPSVLDNLAKNTAWASQLGNAYYNQPGDVMNAVQAMRLQAQQSKVLVTTPQERVVVADAGVITIVPVNPALVYVPYYNPWAIWGGFVTPYPGFAAVYPVGVTVGLGLAFGVGIGIGVFGGFGWGFGAWGAGWGGGGVLYGGNTYISSSTTVINHGNFGGHDRGAFEHGGRGVPGGFHAAAHAGAARSAAARAPNGGHGAAGARGGAGARAGAGRPGGAGARAGAGRPGGAGARPGAGARAGAGRPGGGAARPGGSSARAGAGASHSAARPSGGASHSAARPSGGASHSAARPSGGASHSAARPSGGASHSAARPSGGASHSAARPSGGGARPSGGGAARGGGGGHAAPAGGGHHK